MKVRDLIEVLQKIDPEAVVLIPGYESGFDLPERCELTKAWKRKESYKYRGDYESEAYIARNGFELLDVLTEEDLFEKPVPAVEIS